MRDVYERAAGAVADKLAKPTGWSRESDDYQVMKYGIDAILRNTVTVLLLMVIAFFLGIAPYTAVFLLVFGALRSVSFGVHAPNPYLCTLVGFIRTIGGTCLALWLARIFPVWGALPICAVSSLIFWRYAPAETRKRPIPPGQRKRFTLLSRRTLLLVLAIVLLLSVLKQAKYAYAAAMALAWQTMNLCPFMYRLFEK